MFTMMCMLAPICSAFSIIIKQKPSGKWHNDITSDSEHTLSSLKFVVSCYLAVHPCLNDQLSSLILVLLLLCHLLHWNLIVAYNNSSSKAQQLLPPPMTTNQRSVRLVHTCMCHIKQRNSSSPINISQNIV